jgi:RNase H-like domain found in reverse transcriptase
LFVYEKELLALIIVVIKWRHYLTGFSFTIRTEHISLKNLLDQKINTAIQHLGLSKLLGLDYTIVYKKGSDNKAANTLSRKEEPINPLCSMQAQLSAIFVIVPQWVQDMSSSYKDTWCTVGIDFITALPKHTGKDVIMVVVDRLIKYAHFIALSRPYTALTVAQALFHNVYKFHGLPNSIVADRNLIFTCRFWKELMGLLGKTDGQTERVNQCLENYLCSMLLDKPKSWTNWLPLTQWWYNSNFHSSLKTTPFQALYGYPPTQPSLGHPPRS